MKVTLLWTDSARIEIHAKRPKGIARGVGLELSIGDDLLTRYRSIQRDWELVQDELDRLAKEHEDKTSVRRP